MITKIAIVLAGLMILARQYPEYIPSLDRIIADQFQQHRLLMLDKPAVKTAQR
jgi:hypothetical protein